MRKILTASMIAGAALMVAACGGEPAANNTATTDLGNDTMMDANATGDMGMDNMAVDANATVTDANATVDANMTTDTNAQ